MTNTERIQANNAELREAIEMAENLPDAGGEVVEAVIEPLSITENGTYEASEGIDGFSPVIVNVPEKEPVLQSKTVLPDTEIQVVMPDDGYDGLYDVTVEAMPTAAQAVPVIDVDTMGLITATAMQAGGYVEDGIERVTRQLPTISATIIKPTESEQVAVSAGTFVTGDIKVAAVESGGGGGPEPDDRELYQRVEYIESAEEETYPYIITDFYADNSCGAEIVASFPKLQDRIPMGSRENSDATRFYVVYPLSANSIYYGFNTGSTVSCKLKVDTIYRLQTNFLNSRLVNVYNAAGTRMGGAAISGTLATQSAPLSIFGYNYASTGNVSSKREFKLYSARCSRGHEVVREYIPCYRKSDGVVGLYEKINKQFLTNAAATGSFAAGPEVDWE